MGNEDPMASMDAGGKVVLARHNEISNPNPDPNPDPNPNPSPHPNPNVLARHNEISTLDVKKLEGQEVNDGERLVLPAKELDVCEIYPQNLLHNSNGRFAVVTGDGEYILIEP